MKQYVTRMLIPLQTPAPKSGIDLVLLFDLSDDIALKRAEGRTCKTQQELFSSPPRLK